MPNRSTTLRRHRRAAQLCWQQPERRWNFQDQTFRSCLLEKNELCFKKKHVISLRQTHKCEKLIVLNSIGTRFYSSYYVLLCTTSLLLTSERVSEHSWTTKAAFDVTKWCRSSTIFHWNFKYTNHVFAWVLKTMLLEKVKKSTPNRSATLRKPTTLLWVDRKNFWLST